MRYYVEYYCNTNVGLVRKENQDNYICIDENYKDNKPLSGAFWSKNQVLGVFDGMGGEQCGKEASIIASETAKVYDFKGNIERTLSDFCYEANKNICNYAANHNVSSMGTTVALLCFSKSRIYLCNIGDSRIYRIIDNEMEQLSFDHVVKNGAYKRKPPLSQNLGIPEEEMIIQPYIVDDEYRIGAKYLICSDGITDMVKDNMIKDIITNNDCKVAGDKIIKEAIKNGGRDNITAIVCNIEKKRLF